MVWQGVIIENSLEDMQLFEYAKIVGQRSSTLEQEEDKGRMIFFSVEIEDVHKKMFVKQASKSIKEGFYIHICNIGKMIVIYKSKVFEFSKDEQNEIDEARSYGLSKGILREQMEFEHLIDNPFD